MKSNPFVRRASSLLALTFAAMSAACESSDPLALHSEPVVLMGRVSSLSSPAAGPAMADGSSSLSGIEVSVEGGAATTITDDSGSFRLEVEAGDDAIVLRFRRGSLDVRMEIGGLVSGTTIRLEVSLHDSGGTVIHRDDDHDDDDFEGRATFVSLTGDAPARTLRVELTRVSGPSVEVDVVEGSTVFDGEGDVLTFAALLAALERTDVTVRIEGDGDIQDGGVRVATFVKVETDEHQDGSGDDNGNDDDDDGVRSDFEGRAELLSVSGTAPSRTARVELVSNGDSIEVVIAEEVTVFDGEGDVLTFAGLLAALDRSDVTVRIEGDGEIEDGGVRVATFVKVETDEHQDDPNGDDDHARLVEFKGTAELVSVSGTVPARTARVRVRGEVSGQARVWLVDLVEGETSFDASGDFHSVGSVLTALASAGAIGRLEGKGTLEGDVIVAATARAEVD